MKLLSLAVISFLFNNTQSQNLIQNGSFEISTNNDCYGSFNHHILPNPHVLNNWYNFNSPDYYSTVCSGWYNIPNSYFGYSPAKHGSAYVGISLHQGDGTEYKEYFYQQLSAPLQASKIYCLSFWVTRSDKLPDAVKQIGAFFSNTLPTLNSYSYINATPQVENSASIITDTTQWVQIQGCFTAQGGEQYVTFGNFHNNLNTDTLYVPSNNPLAGMGVNFSYYYFDDILLYDQSTVGFNELSNGASVNVYPNPSSGKIKLVSQNLKDIEHCIIKIRDVLGREVIQLKFEEEIDISYLEKGIYFVSILQGNKTLVTKKVVKQ